MKPSASPEDRAASRLCAGVALWVLLLAPPCALAQVPWQVTVAPTMNPLPVGLCAAVRLDVRDSTGTEVPRNPQGYRITLADFDMTVTSQNSAWVVGQQIDASHWSVCACQGADFGTTATITASYPARSLIESVRVSGASIQVAASFELAAPKGTANPPACATPAMGTARAAIGVSPVSPTTGIAPIPAPTPVVAGNPVTRVAPKGPIGSQVLPYQPEATTVSFDLDAEGVWFVPAPVNVSFDLSASGSWFVPASTSVTLDISATGSWIELSRVPAGEIQPTPRPR